MERRPENLLTFRSLYCSPIVDVRDYRCRAGRSGPAAEEYSGINGIVLMRAGVFSKHFSRRSLTADVNQTVFFSKGSTYRVSHPADCGDRGTVLVAAPGVLGDIVRELDPSVDDHPERPFPFVTGPCDCVAFSRHHALVQELETAHPDPLWVDVAALQLMADVLEAAFAWHGRPRRRRRSRTEADHVDRAEAAKKYLASRLNERITLHDVARAVYASPFHLARVFRQRTGLPIHRYMTRLRLRAAHERLADGVKDITALALELGFSSHSHLTDSFRREFGRAPSDVRGKAERRTQLEMSKNLEA